MEVIHTVEGINRKFQFLRDGDRYTVAWDDTERPRRGWLPPDAMIGWALMPSSSDTFRQMDKFILNYFPESLVTLVALENS